MPPPPTASPSPPPSLAPPRSTADIIANLLFLLSRRQTDHRHLLSLSAADALTSWPMEPFLSPLEIITQALASEPCRIPPALVTEIRVSLQMMEREAECLRKDIELNFWWGLYAAENMREEEDLVSLREERRRRWVGVLRRLEEECGLYAPPRVLTGGNVEAGMAALGLQ